MTGSVPYDGVIIRAIGDQYAIFQALIHLIIHDVIATGAQEDYASLIPLELVVFYHRIDGVIEEHSYIVVIKCQIFYGDMVAVDAVDCTCSGILIEDDI